MNGQPRWTRSEEIRQTTRENDSIVENRKVGRKRVPRPHETEEEAIVRRFHDAQRMARFRARKKKAVEDAKAREAAKMAEIAMIRELKRRNVAFHITNTAKVSQKQNIVKNEETKEVNFVNGISNVGQTKYCQLLSIIEELGRNVRLTYAGSRTSAERLKIGIVRARALVRDCLMENEINARQ